jgi:hypothetical protein
MLFDKAIPFSSAEILKRSIADPTLAPSDHIAVLVTIR